MAPVSKENYASAANNAGSVAIAFGSASWLGNGKLIHQNSSGVNGSSESGDRFGSSLAAGDFDGDGYEDLVVGVPGESIEAIRYAGMVNVLYGTSSGPQASGNQTWHQDSPNIPGGCEANDRFGSALATGDFNGDTFMDLAITILIMGILTAVAVPKFADTLHRHRLTNAARQLKADIDLARRFARAKTSSETLTFNTTSESYSFSSLTDPNHHSLLKLIDLSKSPFQCEITDVNFNSTTAVTFNSYGVPDNGGTITLSCASYQMVVTVDAETGGATSGAITVTPFVPAAQ